jgi:glycerophosphoryl diester phosphodiesterase
MPDDRIPTPTDPTTVAHRGFAGVNPENTVGAVRAAAASADRVEVDVVACADGTPVVFHDAHLDGRGDSRGLTDGRGAVRDLSADAVTAAEVADSGETVPTLGGLLDATSVPLDVELKAHANGPVRRGTLPAGERVAARDRWLPLVDRVLDALDGRSVRLSSFCEGALAAVRERDPSRALAPICRDAADGLELAERYDTTAIHPSLTTVGTDLVAAAHDAGREVNVWTVRTWQEARAAVAAGADGLVADYPGLDRWLGT